MDDKRVVTCGLRVQGLDSNHHLYIVLHNGQSWLVLANEAMSLASNQKKKIKMVDLVKGENTRVESLHDVHMMELGKGSHTQVMGASTEEYAGGQHHVPELLEPLSVTAGDHDFNWDSLSDFVTNAAEV